ncbi:gluconokinase [Glutamicibacter endophyticus]|uniref:gluconokinase n=1 Tax=Glutamicibacter endophyticus TaxID=1522174 RepID=UPI003AEFCDC1
MMSDVTPMVVMGVSGSGKSTVGAMIAQRLGIEFIDGDSLHPESNRAKMAAGQPLDDADRRPWLEIIGRTLAESQQAGAPVVIACSALKRSYRDLIRSFEPTTRFVHLAGTPETLSERLAARNHEFMPASLLTSQLSTLEEPGAEESAILADISASPEDIVTYVIDTLSA